MKTLLGQDQAGAREAASGQPAGPGSLTPGNGGVGGTPQNLFLWGPQFSPSALPEKLPAASLSPSPKAILIPEGSLAPQLIGHAGNSMSQEPVARLQPDRALRAYSLEQTRRGGGCGGRGWGGGGGGGGVRGVT